MGIRQTTCHVPIFSSVAEELLVVVGYLVSMVILASTQFLLNHLTSPYLGLPKPMQEVVLISEIVFVPFFVKLSVRRKEAQWSPVRYLVFSGMLAVLAGMGGYLGYLLVY